jgi:AbrB family looped-hinge helix DNA binding protein
MTTLTISPQGQITIPIALRKTLNMTPGTQVIVNVINWVKEKSLVISAKPKSSTNYSLGLGQDVWKNINADKYIQEMRKEWD